MLWKTVEKLYARTKGGCEDSLHASLNTSMRVQCGWHHREEQGHNRLFIE
jgi:hypothetical protein